MYVFRCLMVRKQHLSSDAASALTSTMKSHKNCVGRFHRPPIEINPGKPHQWGKVTIHGLKTKDLREVEGRIRPLGGPFREDVLQTRLEREEQRLRKLGYVEVHADYEVTTNNNLI